MSRCQRAMTSERFARAAGCVRRVRNRSGWLTYRVAAYRGGR